MKIEYTKSWCLRMAQLEIESGIDSNISAGSIANYSTEKQDVPVNSPQDRHVAFGIFIRLMRRRQKLSVEKLSELADIELAEAIEIEADSRHLPEARAVYQLAKFFGLPVGKLMQLSGLSAANDSRLVEESVRFAARSDSVEELSAHERAALDAFVSVLSEK